MALYAFFEYKTRSFNYERANIFQIGLHSTAALIGIIVNISNIIDRFQAFFTIAVLGSLILMALITLLFIKRQPKYLIQEEIDTQILFRFAYRFDSKIQMLEEHLRKQQQRLSGQQQFKIMKQKEKIDKIDQTREVSVCFQQQSDFKKHISKKDQIISSTLFQNIDANKFPQDNSNFNLIDINSIDQSSDSFTRNNKLKYKQELNAELGNNEEEK